MSLFYDPWKDPTRTSIFCWIMVSYLPTIKIFSSNWKMKKYSEKLVGTSKETPTGIIPALGKTNIMNLHWFYYQYHEFTIIFSNSLLNSLHYFRYQDRLKIAQEYGLFDQKFHFHQGQYDIIGAWAIWGHMGPWRAIKGCKYHNARLEDFELRKKRSSLTLGGVIL